MAAADARAFYAAGGVDRAAAYGDITALAVFAAADARAFFAAGGRHRASVDRDGAARAAMAAVIAAADARAVLAAGDGDIAAVNGDRAARFSVAAADARAAALHFINGQHAHALAGALGVDGQAVAVGHGDARRDVERRAVREDQVRLAADNHAPADIHFADGHNPVRPRGGLVCENGVVVAGPLCAFRVKILHGHERERRRHGDIALGHGEGIFAVIAQDSVHGGFTLRHVQGFQPLLRCDGEGDLSAFRRAYKVGLDVAVYSLADRDIPDPRVRLRQRLVRDGLEGLIREGAEIERSVFALQAIIPLHADGEV